MSTNTGIAWTDHTFNGWWGCCKVAQGCTNCYAEVQASRFYGRKIWGPPATTERRIMGDRVWREPLIWDKASREVFELTGRRHRVFAMSMADVLEDHPALVEPRKRFAWLVENTPFLDWQILTKRPENHPMLGWGKRWPENVWFGASAATQTEFDAAVNALAGARATVRFLSLEPLIGPIDLHNAFYRPRLSTADPYKRRMTIPLIHQVIAGGESAQRGQCRTCDIAWLEDMLEQCRAAGVAFFLKQMGSRAWTDNVNRWDFPDDSIEFESDGAHAASAFIQFKDRKGADPAEWPEHLRVQEFPR